MPKFRYEVVDAKGKVTTGVVEANNVNDASRLLKADGKYIASIKADSGASFLNADISSPKLKTKDSLHPCYRQVLPSFELSTCFISRLRQRRLRTS